MLKNIFFVLMTLWLFTQNITAQKIPVSNNLKFKNISLEDGLSQSSVLCILQDRNGFIWFGTRDGLNKFDGNTFKVYRYNALDSTSISNSYIKTLFEDQHGSLWVGTANGLNRFNSKKDNFTRFFFTENLQGERDEIWDITDRDENYLWISTNEGLRKFNPSTEQYELSSTMDNNIQIPPGSTRDILPTNDGNLWVKYVGKVVFADMETGSIKSYPLPGTINSEDNVHSKSCLFEDNKGNIWLGFESGLAMLNKSADQFEFFKLPDSDEVAIPHAVRNIAQDENGTLWIGTYKGLFLLAKENTDLSHFIHDENDPNSLTQNSIYSIYPDLKGDIWIGTYAGGISYFNRNFDLFRHYSPGINNTKLNYKVVSGIIENPNGDLWIGTEGGGVNYYHAKTGKYSYYTHDSNNPNSLSANNVKAILRGKDGNLWIGTHDEGLNFLNPPAHSNMFKKIRHDPNNNNSLSDDRVIELYQDDKDKIWIGTSGGGVNVLDSKTLTITRLADKNKVIGDIVFSINQGVEPEFLLAGGENGLAAIDLNTYEIAPINFRKNNIQQVSGGGVLCTYIDKNKNIWIGTEGDGLYQFNPKTGSSIRYGTAEGLPNEVIYGILPDDMDNLWLSTNFGLSRLNLSTKTFKNFDASDGLQANEFNYGAYFKNKKGELYFGGVNGFNRFDPARITSNTYIPPVAITSFRVNNNPYLHLLDSKKKIVLNHDQNVLNFDFVALSYSQPNKNQYAFMMEGFDTEYNLVGNQKTATYTNLDAGTYTFKVKGSNNDGLWNEVGDQITITIRPVPWKTWWAYLLYCLLGLTIFFIIRKYSLQRIRDRNQLKNERLEKQRIEEVNKLKLELFTNISHDFRTPLTLIMGPLKKMIKRGKGDSEVQEQHKTMYRNANVLMQLINQLLDFRKTESGNTKLQASEHNVVTFVKEIKLAFKGLAENRHIDYSFSASSENISLWFDKIMLKKILFNLLSNAFKFTQDGGAINIQITRVNKSLAAMPEGYVKIAVSDSGEGIPKENIKRVFERFYQYGERFGTGIGLALSRSLVELHKGVIKVRSAEKSGTIFTVFLPLGNSHLSNEEIARDDQVGGQTEAYNLENDAQLLSTSIEMNTDGQQETSFDESLPSILIVEDNVEVRNFIKSIFQSTYNVYEAGHGETALEIAKTTPIDLIISDVMMPVMDGMDLCHEIKTDIGTSHIPVILLTARTSEKFQKSGYKTGADAYITKPFDADILEVRVNNLIQSRRLLIQKFKNDLILSPKEVTVTSADEKFLQKAISTVEGHLYNTEFSSKSFVKEMHMSRSSLYRKLKSLTGQSISEFIRVIKLKRAAQLLVKSDLNISEIAFDLGFNDQKYFRKAFKKQFKMVPSEYRMEHKVDTE